MVVLTLEKKLGKFRPNYTIDHSSVGSCMFFGTFSKEYGIRLNNTEHQKLGLMAKEKRRKDFNSKVEFTFYS